MKRGLQWPIGIVVILVLTVAANVYVAVRANDDPSVSIESDYYQKAVRFDADQALRHRSERLGWRVTLDATRTDARVTTVRATLVDSGGAPVHGARLRLTAHAVARANTVLSAVARETGDLYLAVLPMDRHGLWDVNVEAVRGTDRFIVTQRLDLPELR